MKKRLISTFLFLALCLSTSTNIIANDMIECDDGELGVNIVTPDAFATLMSGATASENNSYTYAAANIEPEITYSYTFEVREDEPMIADVELDFLLEFGNQTYPITTSGSINAHELSDDRLLWQGPLRGNAEINGVKYSIITGFSKLSSSDDIQVSVTIQSKVAEDAIDPVVIVFGDIVVTNEIFNEIEGDAISISATDFSTMNEVPDDEIFTEIVAPMATNEYSWLAFKYAYFNPQRDDDIPGYAQRARAYFSSGTNRVAVTLKSYCENLDDYYADTADVNYTVIDSFAIELERDGATTAANHSYIIGTESFDFDVEDYGTTTQLQPLFEDIMGVLGVPTSTITSIFDELRGNIERDVNADIANVSVSFGATQRANFDNSDTGVPIVFQLGRTQSDEYTGDSAYIFRTSITYKTVITMEELLFPVTIYTDGYDAEETIELDLS